MAEDELQTAPSPEARPFAVHYLHLPDGGRQPQNALYRFCMREGELRPAAKTPARDKGRTPTDLMTGTRARKVCPSSGSHLSYRLQDGTSCPLPLTVSILSVDLH